ncbi:MAG: DUF3726 domain-containing protein, partial [Alphaproteobacteria bacterium]|nr:DUF3726 domain-containing protein [Alphaproteobacteria bacterium]
MNDQFGPVSLSELQFFVSRAAFGAGCSYGVADDLALLAILLAKQQIDPCPMIAKALDNIAEGKVSKDLEKREGAGHIKLCSKSPLPVSAIYAGLALSDQLAVFGDSENLMVSVDETDSLRLAAYIVQALRPDSRNCEFYCPDTGQSMRLDQLNGADDSGGVGVSFAPTTDVAIDKKNTAINDHHNILVSQSGWDGILNHFKKSLVEATEESR